MKEFTLEELAQYDGKDGKKCYVAYNGKVYDVTDSSFWGDGLHVGMHNAGVDLTSDMDGAPHADEVFEGFEVVGVLK